MGYIGLPTASLLATKGFKVHGVDINAKIVENVSHGEAGIFEPNLDVLVKSAVNSGKLTVSSTPAAADIFIITVQTPFKENHIPDISFVEAATRGIAPYLASGNLVILESTSPVGTTEKIGEWLTELRPDLVATENHSGKPVGLNHGLPVYLAHCPERVLPGQILKELIDNDRIIGGINQASAKKAAAFYRKFVNGNILLTTARTAELSKLVENSFRDLNIAFANELSRICDQLDINVWELIGLANRHPRVNILRPGPGVGGHCIAVDPWFIVDAVPGQTRLIKTAREVNDAQPGYVLDKIIAKAKHFQEPVIACLGLAFKADISDLRESPALRITRKLAESKIGRVLVVEPYIEDLPDCLAGFDQVELVDLNTVLQKADILVLLVDHRIFLEIDRNVIKGKTIIDTRGIWQSNKY
jgi:UDP-N-acetyl-D-mannosaminuronic acid dehydrogenase